MVPHFCLSFCTMRLTSHLHPSSRWKAWYTSKGGTDLTLALPTVEVWFYFPTSWQYLSWLVPWRDSNAQEILKWGKDSRIHSANICVCTCWSKVSLFWLAGAKRLRWCHPLLGLVATMADGLAGARPIQLLWAENRSGNVIHTVKRVKPGHCNLAPRYFWKPLLLKADT